MGASDNLMAGATGVADAASNVGNKYIDYLLRRKSKQEDYLDELNLYKEKLPLTQASALQTKQMESGIDLAKQKDLKTFESGLNDISGQEILDIQNGKIDPLKHYDKSVLPIIKMDVTQGTKEQQQQDKLEEDYRKLHTKTLSNKSGGLGLQDAKVNQAIHLRSLLDQYYDPQTDSYNVPKSQYEEIGIGLANLVSGSNQSTESMRQGIIQKTAKGDIAGAIAYITGSTPTSSTQDVFKNLADSIDRQGIVSEQLRGKYHEDLKKIAPTRLSKDRKTAVESQEIGSSYSDYLSKSPSKSKTKFPVAGESGTGITPAQQKKLKELGL